MTLLRTAVLGILAILSLSANAETIEDRIAPVGKTCLAGEECAAAVQVADAGAASARSGEEVYKKCATCHATGAAGAPKLGDAAAWALRMEKGIEVLYTHAIEGFNGMPAKGLCFDCSDEEIKASVDYIIANSK